MPTPPAVPTLSGGGVTLRAHRPADAAGALEQSLDPLSRRFTTVPLDYTYRDATEFVTEAMPVGWHEDREWAFAVEALDDHGEARYAGTVSLRNEGARRAEVAYGSHPWVRGRGVMEQALRLLLEWGFAEQGLETVIWWAHTGNWASRKLAWRLGFRVEGSARHWLPQRGELRDAWIGTLLAGDERRPGTPWYDVPRVVGDRVVLRRHEPRDAPRILEACTDPQTSYWLGHLPRPYTLGTAHEYVIGREEQHARGFAVNWAVADPADDRIVASLNLFDIAPAHDAEVGYWVHPDARGRGVGTEACRLALRHAFVPVEDGGLGLVRVRALAAEGNAASRRVLEKAGLAAQGRQRRAIRLGDGSLADAVMFDHLAEEFLAHPVGGVA